LVSTQLDIPALIQNPSKIGEEEILMLREELKNSPWCATFQVLIAKGYANVDSYQQNKHLRLASTYIGDRVMLFNMMHTSQEVVSQEEESIVLEVLDAEELEPIVSEIKTAVENDEKLAVEEIAVPIIQMEIDGVLPGSDMKQKPKVEVLEKPVDNGRVPQEKIKNIEVSLQEPAEIEAPGAPFVVEKIDFDKIIKYDPIKELEVLKVSVVPKKKPLSFDTVVYNIEEELSKLIEQKEEAEKRGEQDFTAWLNNVGEDKKDTTPLRKSPDKVQQLLDQFLATKRKRPIQNRAFYSAQNKAEESEVDSMDVLSETLLELYAKQGYHSKAIEGYEKLSLRNPKKSAYFAALIKELQQLQKE
jgi:hypothetical protein